LGSDVPGEKQRHDEQEISLGMDTYCLVVDPGQWTVYGGVVECQLSDDRLVLRLVGLNRRGAIVLRQKWSRGQIEARLANMPRCLRPNPRLHRWSGSPA